MWRVPVRQITRSPVLSTLTHSYPLIGIQAIRRIAISGSNGDKNDDNSHSEDNKKSMDDGASEKKSNRSLNSQDNGNSSLSKSDNTNDSLSETEKKLRSDLEKFSPDRSSRVSNPGGALPGVDPALMKYMQHPKTVYDPSQNRNETNYEFHVPPSCKEKKRQAAKERARGKSAFQKLLPSILVGCVFIWGFYTYNYMTKDKDESKDNDGALLKPTKFLPYVISFKYKIDDDHYLIEVTRKNRIQKLIRNQHLFSGNHVWSVEIAKRDINIVRNLTPLPLFVAGVDPETHKPHLRLVSKAEQEGKFIFIVKRYPDGEFSRWFTGLNLLDKVDIRGPMEEYKFDPHPLDRYPARPQLSNTIEKTEPDPFWPEHLPKPENFVFYGAGTGILPLLQVLYSPNPPKGFVEAFVSLHKQSNLLQELRTLNFFTEKCGRAKFHYLIGEQGEHISARNILQPSLPHFNSAKDLKVSEELYRYRLLQEKKKEVREQMQNSSTTNKGNKGKHRKEVDTSIDLGVLPPLSSNPSKDDIPDLDISKLKPENAFQQFRFLRKGAGTDKSPSLALVCGPDRYIEFVSGKPDLNNVEGKDNGPIGGLLKEKGWNNTNVKRFTGL